MWELFFSNSINIVNSLFLIILSKILNQEGVKIYNIFFPNPLGAFQIKGKNYWWSICILVLKYVDKFLNKDKRSFEDQNTS